MYNRDVATVARFLPAGIDHKTMDSYAGSHVASTARVAPVHRDANIIIDGERVLRIMAPRITSSGNNGTAMPQQAEHTRAVLSEMCTAPRNGIKSTYSGGNTGLCCVCHRSARRVLSDLYGYRFCDIVFAAATATLSASDVIAEAARTTSKDMAHADANALERGIRCGHTLSQRAVDLASVHADDVFVQQYDAETATPFWYNVATGTSQWTQPLSL